MNEKSWFEKKVMENNPKGVYEIITSHQNGLPQKPVDVFAICRDIEGVGIKFADLSDEISGCITKEREDFFLISINKNQSVNRQRFTAAHELTHYLLHREQLGDEFPENTMWRGSLSNKEETEANKGAADILMPYKAIDQYIADNKGFTIRSIAKAFRVSLGAMVIRLGIPIELE